MEDYSISLLITQGITILLLLGVIFYLLRQRRIIRLEKRFEKFSLLSTTEKEKSLFDLLCDLGWKMIHHLSRRLEKSQVLNRYASSYEKFIQFEDKDKISKMDYLSLKFVMAFLTSLLHLFSSMFQLVPLSFMGLLISFFLGFFLPDIYLQLIYQEKRKRVEEDLLKAIIVMNNSFKSGRNIMQAVEIVKNELEGPISDEFKKIYLDMTYGLSIEVVFDRFYHRVKLEDAKYITSSLTMLNKTGGNIVKVFGTIEKSFFEKKKLKQEMESLTSASIFVFRTLCVLPFLFILVIYLLNPLYFEPVFTTFLGRIFLFFTVLLYILYILVIKKVLEVKI